MNNARKILRNTLLLTVASFLMQTVGVSFNVWLTSKIGSVGIGRFQLIMTVYSLAVTLGCGGVRLASTRLTVQAETQYQCTKTAMRKCIRYAFFVGCLVAVMLFSLSDIAASYWLADPKTGKPLRILALTLPFVAMSSALNGYFTAKKKIGRYSAVRILEQGVKIGIVMALMTRCLSDGVEGGSIAIVLGILGSEGFSFAILFLLYNIEKEKYRDKTQKFPLSEILHIAIPDVTGAGARSVLLTIEHLLIPKGFRRSGVSAEDALSVYGNIHGMVFPLLLYPSAILSSLSGLLIPEIAACHERQQYGEIAYIVRRVLSLTLLFSFASASILYTFAEGFSIVIYNTPDCIFYLHLLSMLIPVMYCDMTVDGMLKGMDEQRASMRYNIFDSALCVVLVYFLLPKFAIKGYVFILFLSEILNFFLSFRRLSKVCTVEIHLTKSVLMPIGCAILSSSLSSLILSLTGLSALWNKWILTLAVLQSLCSYLLFLYGFGCVSAEDVRWFLRTTGISKIRTHHFPEKAVLHSL